jgi:hypothetical protein
MRLAMQAEAMPLVQTLNLTEQDEPSMYAVFFPPSSSCQFSAIQLDGPGEFKHTKVVDSKEGESLRELWMQNVTPE